MIAMDKFIDSRGNKISPWLEGFGYFYKTTRYVDGGESTVCLGEEDV